MFYKIKNINGHQQSERSNFLEEEVEEICLKYYYKSQTIFSHSTIIIIPRWSVLFRNNLLKLNETKKHVF